MGNFELPEGTEKVASYSDFSSHYLTIERDEDGIVYLVSWFHHIPKVFAVIHPNGNVESRDFD